MDHYVNIYSHHADIYHRMITAEDAAGNLLRIIEQQITVQGKRLLDLGSGTGRIPLLFHTQAAQIIALDLHWGMLREQQHQREQNQGKWDLLQGDLRVLPFPKNWFDVVTAGWAIGHFQSWYVEKWQTQVDHAIQEMLRVIRPEGVILIIETLTTGSTHPAPPSQGLADYYSRLENRWGFIRYQIQTDYQFPNLEEAIKLSKFFFGVELASKVQENRRSRLPEWTGVWVFKKRPLNQ